MSYLLDTCILSKLRKIKKYPDRKLERWIEQHDSKSFFISVLTIAEIRMGISKLSLKNSDEKKKKLIFENWLFEEIIPYFSDRILPVEFEVALTWGKIVGEGQQRGITIPIVDGLIAATAIANNLTVVTENVSDFIETGARLFNPWL